MQTHPPSVLVASLMIALLLAGCAQSPALAPAASSSESDASAPGGATNGTAAAAPLALYLQSDLTLAPTPPTSEGSVAPAMPANGPWVDSADYPTWTIQLAAAAPNGTANVTFFATSSSASVEAALVPVFAELPQFGVRVSDGARGSYARAEGPTVLRAGEVAEVRVQVSLAGLALAEGATLSLRIDPYYSHFAAAAEVRFLMGPEHPARVEFAP